MRGTLAVIVVYSRRVGLCWLHRQQPQKTVIQNKNVISWECEPRYTTLRETIFFLPERVPGGVHSNIWFHRHFWNGKNSPITAQNLAKTVRETCQPFSLTSASRTYSIISPGWQSRISHSWIMVSTVTLRLFTRLSTVLGLIL